jgi:hypothetical protein
MFQACLSISTMSKVKSIRFLSTMIGQQMLQRTQSSSPQYLIPSSAFEIIFSYFCSKWDTLSSNKHHWYYDA